MIASYEPSNGELIETQVVAGVIYIFKLAFKEPSGKINYFIVNVYVKSWENYYEVTKI